jgi:hypothetical protein
MEEPYQGRAILNYTLNQLEITIPAQKNWFAILFLCAWLCGWAMGEFFAISSITGFFGNDLGYATIFMLVWLCGWTIGGFLAIKKLIWNLLGKEIITCGQGELTIKRQGEILSRPKTYDLFEVKKLRVQESALASGGFYRGSRKSSKRNLSYGTIRFDYGLKTVMFGYNLDEAEANFILEELKANKLITQANL